MQQTLQTLQTSLTAPNTAQQLSLNAGDTETSVSFLNHLEPRYSGLGDDTAGAGVTFVPSEMTPASCPPPPSCVTRGPGNDAATDTSTRLSPDNDIVHPDPRCSELANVIQMSVCQSIFQPASANKTFSLTDLI